MSLKKVVRLLKRKNSFLISAHINLEGDALGSELALARLLKALGKKVYVVNQDKTPLLYKFMPGVKSILQPTGKPLNFEVALIVDCSDLERIGSVKKNIGRDKTIVNVDHHISNVKFGDINWVEPEASSACEMVYEIYREWGFKIDKAAAELLYTGIMVDTGSFRYANTTPVTHLAAADLLRLGISADKIHNLVYGSTPLSELKLFSQLLAGFKVDKTKKIIWLTIKEKSLDEKKMVTDVTEYIFNFFRSVGGIEVALIFRETGKNRVKVNFRSRGKVDVAQIAGLFGGGGHRRASGCTVNAGLNAAQRLVLSKIKKAI